MHLGLGRQFRAQFVKLMGLLTILVSAPPRHKLPLPAPLSRNVHLGSWTVHWSTAQDGEMNRHWTAIRVIQSLSWDGTRQYFRNPDMGWSILLGPMWTPTNLQRWVD
ncbi:uncharacterized protein BO97DRAFT_31508 [Aspergillus homomorphus CBS 101889]|uniref:Uncharacterized protein n=1 Tax=Aspergillus homomorphus (strain CBS 101889) TaxID=1450537 RepID=A0A395I5E3_ASPHC|nr:hypothetical protein BO97DRAFT_31508 [Aspergillus homomorphus CBS 101889]RAL13564.1 hypothetical protein BO97DRAFT_31508 [Aspergillus homomorphus CBS 101889]